MLQAEFGLVKRLSWLCYIVRLLYCSSAVAQDLLFRSSPTGPAIETTNQDDPMIFVGQFSSNGADANDRKNQSIYVLMSRDKSGTKRLNCVCYLCSNTCR